MTALTIKHLHFGYTNSDELFSDASLEVSAASITGLLGANGSGKTTLFDLINEMSRPTAGLIFRQADTLAYLSQTITTSARLSMKDVANMILSLTPSTVTPLSHLLAVLDGWDALLGQRFRALLPRNSSYCSYGERRWFLTLTLLATQPDLIILDEPTAGVDPEYRHYIWKCLRLASREGTAVLVSSHNVDEIAQYTDSYYMLRERRFERFDSGSAFLERFGGRTLDEAFIRAIESQNNES